MSLEIFSVDELNELLKPTEQPKNYVEIASGNQNPNPDTGDTDPIVDGDNAGTGLDDGAEQQAKEQLKAQKEQLNSQENSSGDLISSKTQNNPSTTKPDDVFKDNDFLHFPYVDKNNDEANEFANNGMYFFKLKYNPSLQSKIKLDEKDFKTPFDYLMEEFEMTENEIKEFLRGAVNTASEKIKNLIPEKMLDTLQKSADAMGAEGYLMSYGMPIITNIMGVISKNRQVAKLFKIQENGGIEAWSDAFFGKDYKLGQHAYTDYGDSVNYNEKSSKTKYILLPLNSMKVSRKNGVSATSNLHGSIARSMFVQNQKELLNDSKRGEIYKAEGWSDNPYKGFTSNGADFEEFNLEWDLLPKNEREMEEIMQIIAWFQLSCVSNMDLNNRNNTMVVLPPRCEMGIITSDLTKGKSILKFLRKPMFIYIKGVNIEPLGNTGGVLLGPEGNPMGVKLSVNVTKALLTTIDDILLNRVGTGEDDNVTIGNIQPFN